MKKIVALSLIVVMIFTGIFSAFVFAGSERIGDAYNPNHDVEVFGTLNPAPVMINGVEKPSVVNVNGTNYVHGRQVINAGGTATYENGRAVYTMPKAQKNIDLYESQKAVVRIAVDWLNQGEKQLTVIGNGFFVDGRKILTTRDVYETYKFTLGNQNVGTDTGDPFDTITNVTGIKVILWDDKTIDAKNFRFDDDRVLGTLDTMGYTSKNIVNLGADMKIGDIAYTCTSIESNGNENPIQVANQWSCNKVLRVRYPRDNQYFTLIKNNTDNADSGRGGAVFNSKGDLTGIFCAVENGNNGNCLVKTVSEIKEFLND